MSISRDEYANPFERRAYRVSEFAQMYGVSTGLIYKLRRKGKINISHLAGSAVILREEAERFESEIKRRG